MKPNVKMIDKSKNSFIFFQLGLIATMITVLLVLEFNFKDEFKPIVEYKPPTFPEETVFTYNPRVETPIAKVEPKTTVIQNTVQPKFVNDFKATDDEVKDAVLVTPQDDLLINDVVDTNPTATPTEGIVSKPTENNVYDFTEELPMFTACKGLSKEEQKKCFDAQLSKAITKNLVYPDSDLRSNTEGIVFVQFIIDQNGYFTAITPIVNNRSTEAMRKAVEKAVKKLPKIIPAKQGGNNVKIRYTVPVSFKISK